VNLLLLIIHQLMCIPVHNRVKKYKVVNLLRLIIYQLMRLYSAQ
jgi:hypothetical protein